MKRWSAWVLLVCLLAIQTGIAFCSDKKSKWQKTTATITDVVSFRNLKISYLVNDSLYSKTITGWSSAVVGEKYLCYYNIENPKKVEIDIYHPVFEQGEKTIFYRGKIKKVNRSSFLHKEPFVEYSYRVSKDISVKKWAIIPTSYIQKLAQGQYYNVQVWDSNVYRAVLRLDLPIVSKPEGRIPDRTVPLK